MVGETSHESARASRKGGGIYRCKVSLSFPRLSHSPLVKLSRDFSRLPNMEELAHSREF